MKQRIRRVLAELAADVAYAESAFWHCASRSARTPDLMRPVEALQHVQKAALALREASEALGPVTDLALVEALVDATHERRAKGQRTSLTFEGYATRTEARTGRG